MVIGGKRLLMPPEGAEDLAPIAVELAMGRAPLPCAIIVPQRRSIVAAPLVEQAAIEIGFCIARLLAQQGRQIVDCRSLPFADDAEPGTVVKQDRALAVETFGCLLGQIGDGRREQAV